MVKEIFLNNEQVALVDDEDYDELNKYKWSILVNKNICYARHGERINNKCVKHMYMHRKIMGFPEGKQVDHINHNPEVKIGNFTQAKLGGF